MRTLRTPYGFGATRLVWWLAVATMAVALAANLAVLSTLDRLLFRRLPFHAPERLVQINLGSITDREGQEFPVLFGELTALFHSKATSITGAAIAEGTVSSVEVEPGSSLQLTGVSYNAMDVLGTRPYLGRDFTSADANNPTTRAVLLTYDAWRSRFGSTPDFALLRWHARVAYNVIGVLPPGFVLPSSRLLAHFDGVHVMTDRRHLQPGFLTVAPFARLAPGVTSAVAEQELNVLARSVPWGTDEVKSHYFDAGKRVRVVELQRGMTLLSGTYLWIAAFSPWLILAIACVNISLLLVVRERLRFKDLFIRSALGARPLALVIYVVRDIALLCGLAIAFAIAAGWAGNNWIRAVAPPLLRPFVVSGVDVRLALVTAVIGSATACIASLVPLFVVYRTTAVLPRGAAAGPSPFSRGAATFAFVAGQACFGTVGVFGAVATVPHFIQMLVGPRGFDQTDLYTLRTGHGATEAIEDEAAGRTARVRTVLEHVRSAPGVRRAAASLTLPLGPSLGSPVPLVDGGLKGYQFAVSDGFFETLGTALIAGREFSEGEVTDRNAVVVLNREAVHKLRLSDDPKDAVGQVVRTVFGTRTIVGVSENIVSWPGAAAVPTFFLPISASEISAPSSQLSISVRARDKTFSPRAIRERLDAALGKGRGFAAEYVPTTLAVGLDRPRFVAVLLGALAGIGILLNIGGLYSLATLDVTSRRHEIAVRLSLGSSRLGLVAPINGAAIAGLVAGICGAIAAVVAVRFTSYATFAVFQLTPGVWLTTIGIVLVTSGTALIGPVVRFNRRELYQILRAESL